MPPIPPERMTGAQQAVAREIAAGRRGNAGIGGGPFVPALRSPEFAGRLQRLGEYLRYDMALPPHVRELIILLTARSWSQEYEWHLHAPLAREAGLASQIIDAVRDGRRPEHMSDVEALAYDAFVELHDSRTLGDATFRRMVASFGEQGLIDFLGAVGYYSMLAMIMNVAGTPLPDDAAPAFAKR